MTGAILRDYRFAIRGLRRSPGFTIAVVLTLALGIGATTTVFSVVYAALFRPLPFPSAERLVQIVQVLEPTPTSPEPTRAGLTGNQFVDLQEHSTTLAAVGGYTGVTRTLTGIAVPARLSGAAITAGLFTHLGVAPALGRTFVPDDSAAGADPVVVLSHDTWTRYFGSDPALIDRRIALDDASPRVVGVMPRGFGFPSLAGTFITKNSLDELNDAPEFWMPRPLFARTAPAGRGFSLLSAFAMLEEGVTPEQALAETRTLLSPLPQGRRATLEIVSARREMSRRLERVLVTFQIGVVLILLIACVNVANLLLTRAAHRRRETAIRVALGASRARIIRELTAESLVMASAGGVIGCLMAYALTSVIRALPPHLLPRMREIQVDSVVLIFALVVAIIAGLGVGLLSALRAGSTDTADDATQQALRGMRVSAHRKLRPSNVLVVIEIAVTMVLIAGAGLLINSFARLMRVDPGIEPNGVVTFRMMLPASRYSSPLSQQDFTRTVLADLRQLPEVTAVSATSDGLDAGPIGFYRMVIDGNAIENADVRYRSIFPDFFRALGTSMIQGREFLDTDASATATRVIVNGAFARRYFAGRPAVGSVIAYGDRPSLEIVGVAADAKIRLNEDARPTLYFPTDATGTFASPTFVIRAARVGPALIASLRESVRRLDPQLAVFNVMTVDEMIAHASASSRLYGLVSLWCALIAIVLAAVGLYGVLAYMVGVRTQEFGIRVALGATSTSVVRSVMRQGIVLVATGLVLGLGGAYYATRLLRTLLFDLAPNDAATFVSAAAVFLLVALIACYIPSRRATRVDVVTALRAEG